MEPQYSQGPTADRHAGWVDAHCHLEIATYGQELPAVLERAEAAQVRWFIAVGASNGAVGAGEAVRLAQTTANIMASVGIHPHDAHLADSAAMAQIESYLAEPKVCCLGEVGLDYYYEHSPRAQQQQVLREFLHMAKRCNKPVMLHIRDAHQDALAILDEIGLPDQGGMIHCFTADTATAQAYLTRGMYLSIPGVVTFRNAQGLRDAIPTIPSDRLLLETDCPYLAPVPMRGQRNEPAYLAHTAAAVATIRGISIPSLAAQTSANAARLFGLPQVS